MEAGGNDLRVAEAGRQQRQGVGVGGFEDADAEVFMVGGGEGQSRVPEQAAVRLVIRIAIMDDSAAQRGDAGQPFVGRPAKPLAAQGDAERLALAGQRQQGGHEALRALVELQPLVPEDEWRLRVVGGNGRIEPAKVDADGQDSTLVT